MLIDGIKRHANLKNLIFGLSIFMFVWLCWYFYTGFGGPSELAAHLLPVALALQILLMYQRDYLYKRLPPIANHILVIVYLGICLYAFYHFMHGIRADRDLAAGLLHQGGLHHGFADVPLGDGAVADRP